MGDHKPLLTGTFETIGYDLSGEVLEGKLCGTVSNTLPDLGESGISGIIGFV